MGPRNKIMPEKRVLGADGIGKNTLYSLTSDIPVAVPRRRRKGAFAHTVFNEGGQHFLLIVFGDRVDFLKPVGYSVFHLVRNTVQSLVNIKKFVHFIFLYFSGRA